MCYSWQIIMKKDFDFLFSSCVLVREAQTCSEKGKIHNATEPTCLQLLFVYIDTFKAVLPSFGLQSLSRLCAFPGVVLYAISNGVV